MATDDLCPDDGLDDAEEAGNAECVLNSNEFGRNIEVWYKCTLYGLWAHPDCTEWESATGYDCDLDLDFSHKVATITLTSVQWEAKSFFFFYISRSIKMIITDFK